MTSIEPMEAKLSDMLPDGEGWQFEPKWDGFRCLAFVARGEVELRSKSGKPLGRYFPEVVAGLVDLPDCVLDGELIIPVGPTLSFEALQMRLHPAESRVRKLAAETPARLMLFDILSLGKKTDLANRSLAKRRAALESFFAKHRNDVLRLSPTTGDRDVAQRWFAGTGSALDGVVAKRLDDSYRPGERAMVKVKRMRTADCVVGGFRYGAKKKEVSTLLLGLYDDERVLHHVGHCSGLAAVDKVALTEKLESLAGEGFTGDAPGGPSRWATERSTEWCPLKPELVVEVRFDHVTGRRFRHGTGFLRWRPDKRPDQCTMTQLGEEVRPALVDEAIAGS